MDAPTSLCPGASPTRRRSASARIVLPVEPGRWRAPTMATDRGARTCHRLRRSAAYSRASTAPCPASASAVASRRADDDFQRTGGRGVGEDVVGLEEVHHLEAVGDQRRDVQLPVRQ